MRSLKLLLGVLSVHGFAPPMPRVDRRSVARNFDAATAAADILADPTARFEAATVVLLASFASKVGQSPLKRPATIAIAGRRHWARRLHRGTRLRA